MLGEVSRRDLKFVLSRLAGIDPAIKFANLGLAGRLSAASRAARPEGLEILSWTSLLLSRCRLWARLASCDRSHSHAVSPCGWPNTFRKYVPSLGSGSCIACVPAGSPEYACEVAVTRWNASYKHFRTQPLGIIAGEVLPVFEIVIVWQRTQLVRARRADRADQVLQVEAAGDEVLRQCVEQFGIRGRIRLPHVVFRFDDSAAEEMLPVAIDQRPGEERVVGPRHPVGQLHARIVVGRNR